MSDIKLIAGKPDPYSRIKFLIATVDLF